MVVQVAMLYSHVLCGDLMDLPRVYAFTLLLIFETVLMNIDCPCDFSIPRGLWLFVRRRICCRCQLATRIHWRFTRWPPHWRSCDRSTGEAFWTTVVHGSRLSYVVPINFAASRSYSLSIITILTPSSPYHWRGLHAILWQWKTTAVPRQQDRYWHTARSFCHCCANVLFRDCTLRTSWCNHCGRQL